ncbi:hypothetical protein ACFPTY_10275 [Halomonas beimenensis]|uniref:Uncharacterized protein n=1 Tax=Halomonas beimenensis TaxID=475662 RepID=A0A291P959_9GAMM|nr:hypothetical protein [Halomonas beimenensis]ATJ83397.1 hypothetical protein BEI_2410 [Halomonas beimenensis]
MFELQDLQHHGGIAGELQEAVLQTVLQNIKRTGALQAGLGRPSTLAQLALDGVLADT